MPVVAVTLVAEQAAVLTARCVVSGASYLRAVLVCAVASLATNARVVWALQLLGASCNSIGEAVPSHPTMETSFSFSVDLYKKVPYKSNCGGIQCIQLPVGLKRHSGRSG